MDPIFDIFDKIICEIENATDDVHLADLLSIIKTQKPPSITLRNIPSHVEVDLLINPKFVEEDAIHHKGFNTLKPNDTIIRRVTGTLDAMIDNEYRFLFDQYGWRTIFYLLLKIKTNTDFRTTDNSHSKFETILPIVIHSRHPDAINEKELFNILFSNHLMLMAMHLRFALVWTTDRTNQLWNAIPSALFLLSPGYIYEANEIARNWFKIPLNLEDGIKIDSVFSIDIVEKIRHLMSKWDDTQMYHVDQISWLSPESNKQLIFEATLYPYRILENARFNETMQISYRGISIKELHKRLFMLMIRDITDQFEAERLKHEFAMARKMQRALLPSSLPKPAWLEIAAASIPANHIGGDFFDVISVEDGRTAVLIGDAAGQGIDSTLLVALVSGAFRATVQRNSSPQIVLSSIDRALRATPHPGYVTIAYLLFEEDGRQVYYGLAGHHPPIVCSPDKTVKAAFNPVSLPLGIKFPPNYAVGKFEIEPGSIIGLFSDGLLNQRNADNESFEQWIHTIIKFHLDENAQKILDAIIGGANLFRKNKEISDDITAVIINSRR